MKDQYFRPLIIDWELTYACNYNCNFCYLHKKEDIKFNMLQSIAHKINDIHPFEIKIGGGEPLLLSEKLFEITELLSKNIRLTLVTNGSLVSIKNIPLIKKYFSKVQVSLHSFNPQNHSQMCRTDEKTFETVINNILLLQQHEIKTILNFVLNTQNKNDFTKIYDFAKKHNLTIRVLRYRGEKYKLEEDQKFFENYVDDPLISFDDGFNFADKGVCGAINEVLAISPDGDVYPCTWLRTQDMKLGNIQKTSFEKILSTEKAIQLQKELSTCAIGKSENCPVFLKMRK